MGKVIGAGTVARTRGFPAVKPTSMAPWIEAIAVGSSATATWPSSVATYSSPLGARRPSRRATSKGAARHECGRGL